MEEEDLTFLKRALIGLSVMMIVSQVLVLASPVIDLVSQLAVKPQKLRQWSGQHPKCSKNGGLIYYSMVSFDDEKTWYQTDVEVNQLGGTTEIIPGTRIIGKADPKLIACLEKGFPTK